MIRIDRIDDYATLRKNIATSPTRPGTVERVLHSLDSETGLTVFGAYADDRLAALCTLRFLEWDSDFFGKQSYQTEIFIIEPSEQLSNQLSDLVEASLHAISMEGAEFVSARVDVTEGNQIRALEMSGFLIYDLSCIFGAEKESLTRIRPDCPAGLSIRESRDGDVWRLIDLSANAFSFDRFHQDKGFGKECADAMHGIWIRNLHYSKESSVWVAEVGKEIVGYVTYQKSEFSFDSHPPELALRIGLIAVDQKHSGMGIGSALVNNVLVQCHAQKAGLVVGTQLSNKQAMRLYQSRGLSVVQAFATLHLWLKNESDEPFI